MGETEICNMCKSIYAEYNLESLSYSERQYFLRVLSGMLGVSIDDEDVAACYLSKYTVEELRERVAQSMQEIRDGKGQPIDDFLEEVAKDYPWVFK